jgi:hypothetical protein
MTAQHGHAGPQGRGQSKTYTAWRGLAQRARRGEVEADPAWLTFPGFLADMGECPPEHRMARRDKKAPYSKANCEWLPLGTRRPRKRPGEVAV